MEPLNLSYLAETQRRLKAEAQPIEAVTLDEVAACDAVADAVASGIGMEAASAVNAWVETDPADLADGETLVDRLYGLLSGVVDRDEDGELNDEESSVFEVAVNAAWDYLSDCGVSDEDCAAIFDEESNEAAERARDLLAESLEEGDAAMDSALLHACMPKAAVLLDSVGPSWAKRHRGKMTLHAHHGKRKVTAHRMKWKRQTAAQRAALKKNSRRSFSARARALNRRSNLLTRKMGGRKVI